MAAVVKRNEGPERATRANGDASRRRLLDAAAQVAGERGYAGTSINEVSDRSGLPKSSIYWHFGSKDALFAAVIEDSYERWRAGFASRIAEPPADVGAMIENLYDSLRETPAFLRFGQLIVLEQHEQELAARAKFVEIRQQALADLRAAMMQLAGVDDETATRCAAVALALVDGASLAHTAGESTLDGPMLGDVLRTYLHATRETSNDLL